MDPESEKPEVTKPSPAHAVHVINFNFNMKPIYKFLGLSIWYAITMFYFIGHNWPLDVLIISVVYLWEVW
jgi:hypothetical protein